jgi:hypothetical protein
MIKDVGFNNPRVRLFEPRGLTIIFGGRTTVRTFVRTAGRSDRFGTSVASDTA